MSDWDDVRRIALALPDTHEETSRGLATWRVRDKGFVWERPLRSSDLRALGDQAPAGPILGARVEHLVAKEALLADDPDVFFTTPWAVAKNTYTPSKRFTVAFSLPLWSSRPRR